MQIDMCNKSNTRQIFRKLYTASQKKVSHFLSYLLQNVANSDKIWYIVCIFYKFAIKYYKYFHLIVSLHYLVKLRF